MAGIWSGTLTFGLVALPVHLHPALRPRTSALTMLHRKDAAPLKRRMICPKHDRVIESDEQVRGFEITEERYVVVRDEELEALAPERSRAIEIERFVALDEIEPLYFDRPYHLAPASGGERPYYLLVQALEKEARAGIARFVLRDREHLVAVIAREGILTLITLHYRHQVVDPEELAPKDARGSHDRLGRLLELIESQERHFDPEAYRDENELDLLARVKKKARAEGVEESPQARPAAPISGKRAARRIDEKIGMLRKRTSGK